MGHLPWALQAACHPHPAWLRQGDRLPGSSQNVPFSLELTPDTPAVAGQVRVSPQCGQTPQSKGRLGDRPSHLSLHVPKRGSQGGAPVPDVSTQGIARSC